MPISKNLQYLRKREGVTQEELAEQMQVSRQAVSKWETGEAYPDTDKLIALCDRFGVSMDDFVRGDLTANKSHTVPDEILTSEPDAQDGVNADNARAHIKRFACRISLGVFLVLLGVAVCVAMCAVATVYGQGNTANIISAMSGVAVVVFVAVAVFLFVLAGISHNNYARINGLACPFEKTELENLNKNFALVTACSVSNLILDVAALIVAEVVFSNLYEIAFSSAAYDWSLAIVSVFIFILAFPVAALCYISIVKSLIEQANFIADRSARHTERSRKENVMDAVCGAIMLIATAVFLLIGFIWNLWHPGWIVFPIGGIICSIVRTLSKINKG